MNSFFVLCIFRILDIEKEKAIKFPDFLKGEPPKSKIFATHV